MLRDFNANVRQTLQRHGVQDEKLELVLTDLFKDFQKHILSRDAIREITEQQEREKFRHRRNMGRV